MIIIAGYGYCKKLPETLNGLIRSDENENEMTRMVECLDAWMLECLNVECLNNA